MRIPDGAIQDLFREATVLNQLGPIDQQPQLLLGQGGHRHPQHLQHVAGVNLIVAGDFVGSSRGETQRGFQGLQVQPDPTLVGEGIEHIYRGSQLDR